jgi:hypothetical protein
MENIRTIVIDPLSECPAHIRRLGDLPGGGVGRWPVPWLLVPGHIAGVERLRADRDYL